MSFDPKPQNTEIWDLPTRTFHWMLVCTIAASWYSSESIHFQIHLFSGYLLLMLLLFRIVWGVIGGRYSRFLHFTRPWRAVREHLQDILQKKSSPKPGHNPAAGWMVILLLGILLLITLSGLTVLGGEEQVGPFRGQVTMEAGVTAHQVHLLLAWLLILLIPLHLSGIALEQWTGRRGLLRAMISGHYQPGRTSSNSFSNLMVGMALLFSFPLFSLWLSQSDNHTPAPLYTDSTSTAHPGYLPWREECGSCHTLHHPSLLPARSWSRMMKQQQNHFDEDLAIETGDKLEISHYLQQFAAEQSSSEASWRINNSIPAIETPLQITTTHFWKETHREIDPALWDHPAVGGKIHCDGCHQDATDGTFRDQMIVLPGRSRT